MVVETIAAPKQAFVKSEPDISLFCKSFKECKSNDEFGSYLVGKDSAYAKPTV